MKLSVVIVSYNTRELLRRCLASLDEADEVIVVDNASADGSAAMVAADYPAVRLIANPVNRGFGAANNQGTAAARGEYVLFLNSDAAATPGALRRLTQVLDTEPGTVAVGGRLTHPDGRTQASCCARLTLWAVFCEQTRLEKAFPRSPWLSPYWLTERLMGRAGEVFAVEQVMGACLMARGRPRFDERFFLYVEDTELCHRLRLTGSILWVKDAVFTHELGASSVGTRWEAVARYNRGKELFFRLHHGPAAAAGCLLLDRAGALGALAVWTLATVLTLGQAPRVRRQVPLWLRVLLAPTSGPPRPPDSA